MAVLEITGVTVRFGGLMALSDVTMSAESGMITGLIGPNGAGKTTLFNVITGLQTPQAGRVVLDGRDVTTVSAYKRARQGLARTFQRLEVFDSLSVRDNILVAAESTGDTADVDRVIDLVGLGHVVDAPVDRLPTGMARLVELCRAVATSPKVLLCDECSSGLTDEETQVVGAVIRRVAAEGVAVLLVEHDMSFVMGTCDVIHVLNLGVKIAEGTPAEIQGNSEVRVAYLGEAKDEAAPRTRAVEHLRELEAQARPPIVELRDVHAGYGTIDVLHGVSLTIAPGEVFALLGPNGAGKSTTLKVLNGEVQPSSGDVLLCGESVLGVPVDALARAGLCTIPEGRGIFPNLTVDDNLRMSTYTGASLGAIRDRAFTQFPRLAERRKQLAGTLSGGEQQMLALARALVVDPAVLIIDELSMGLAPIIVERLYEIVAEVAESEAIAILIIEQFAHDVLGVATKAGVMLHGRLVTVGSPDQIALTISDAYLASTAEELA
jgi:ABC-type branched-subunit amino acid transport system ATPase component